MRKQFYYDSKKESVSAYVARMALIIDAIKTGDCTYVDPELIASIDVIECGEIHNEVARLIDSDICAKTRMVTRTVRNLDDYADDFSNILRLEVLKVIGQFNNPKYLSGPRYSLDAFIGGRVTCAKRKTLEEKRGRKHYQIKREAHVRKILEHLEKKNPTVEDIFNNQHLAYDSMNLDRDQIWDVLVYMEDTVYLNDVTDYEPSFTENGFERVENKEIMDEFATYLSKFQSYERYIYNQVTMFRLGEITEKEISCDDKLIEMCKSNPDLSEQVVKGTVIIDRPKSRIKPHSQFEESVSLEFIRKVAYKIDAGIRKYCEERQYSLSEIMPCLTYLKEVC